ncbi:PREDICTED: pre-mRNA-splicing factor SYF1-like [Amphimedon queenslandica]|uniref:Suppressor of forked domain-containing protein n=1 Tax=Amphimedon queenslandica TaxID=400682 RepID=A0AAN0JPQ0_AMPQE|nr:PREDICTED: pre-mRNA-splicing factor SYF1-like [Amphimedon queenslandica]|eukprot:XP_019858778.1 PREDICTED: pre-mRNA-splicing factor SYF1-like [Amphimedon queenslandica]
MPRIWMDYCQFLTEQNKITRTRRTFDRSLRSLPLTQHKRIWPLYIKFLRLHNLPETTVRVYRRYIQLCPENSEEFVDYLISIDRLDEAAIKLAEIVNKESFFSKEGKSKFQLWYKLCELIAKNPDIVTSLNVEAIIRGGIKRFTDMVDQLWCSLADYHIKAGRFERGRDIYNEGIHSVITVRDFTQIFDAYSQYEETMIQSKMESTTELTEEDASYMDGLLSVLN